MRVTFANRPVQGIWLTDAGVGVKVGELREEAMAHATEPEYRRLERMKTEREAAAVAADVPVPDLAARHRAAGRLRRTDRYAGRPQASRSREMTKSSSSRHHPILPVTLMRVISYNHAMASKPDSTGLIE